MARSRLGSLLSTSFLSGKAKDARRARARVRVSRGRGLPNMERAFGQERIVAAIERGLSGGDPRVLELGCGEGRALLEMKKAWPALDLHGVNRRPWPGMSGSESLRGSAVELELFTRDEAGRMTPPTIHFTDASELPLADESVDLIVSQVALHYVKRKDKVLAEAWRVLRPGARAFLHVDTTIANPPDYLQHPSPRFLIYEAGDDRGRAVPGSIEDVLQPLEARGFAVRIARVPSKKDDRERVHVEIEKTRPDPLPLDLEFDERSSFNLAVLTGKRYADFAWGYRSVFVRRDPS